MKCSPWTEGLLIPTMRKVNEGAVFYAVLIASMSLLALVMMLFRASMNGEHWSYAISMPKATEHP